MSSPSSTAPVIAPLRPASPRIADAAQGLRPYRQYYLSFDVDLRRIPTRSKFLRRSFYALSIIHLPAPALELNGRGNWRLHGLYY